MEELATIVRSARRETMTPREESLYGFLQALMFLMLLPLAAHTIFTLNFSDWFIVVAFWGCFGGYFYAYRDARCNLLLLKSKGYRNIDLAAVHNLLKNKNNIALIKKIPPKSEIPSFGESDLDILKRFLAFPEADATPEKKG